jgi:chaperonin cofactor prefoldin
MCRSDLGNMNSYVSDNIAEDLCATADRLQQRTERLQGRTRELRQSAKRLKAATKRLKERLTSSFPPPPDSEPPAR